MKSPNAAAFLIVFASLATTAFPAHAGTSAQRGTDSLVVVSCENPRIRDADVHAIFGAQSRMNARMLQGALRRAVMAACEQNIARITVERRGSSIGWTPAPVEKGATVAAR